jgi:hypothetical protein
MYFDCHPVDAKEQKNKLYVVTAIINPCRYQTRYRLYVDFAKMVEDSGGVLYTVECAFGNRPHEVTQKDNARHVQIRTKSEVWHKENMLNIGISRLPPDWEYVAWVDADVMWARPDWVKETLQQLQHYHVVQMFSVAQDLGPNSEPINLHKGFVYQYQQLGDPFDLNQTWDQAIDDFIAHRAKQFALTCYAGETKKGIESWHPGFAWAARREAIDALGGLVDWAILGAADRHMAYALIGRCAKSIPGGVQGTYRRLLMEWEQRAEKYIRRNIGFVPGMLLHRWHGNKSQRRYQDRWNIVIKHKFDPELDLKKDWQGLWQLTEKNRDLRDDLRHYFRMRNEDSIDLDSNQGRE